MIGIPPGKAGGIPIFFLKWLSFCSPQPLKEAKMCDTKRIFPFFEKIYVRM